MEKYEETLLFINWWKKVNFCYFGYFTVDVRSMAFLRLYVDASKELAEQSSFPFARVECFDWTDVCAKENITSYPTIRVFRKGMETVPYKGMLDKDAVLNMVKL